MSWGLRIAGLLLFAMVTAVIYIWGMKKSMNTDLNRDLLSVCGNRVIKYLKKNGTVTESQVADIIKGVTVGPVWSKQKAKVTDGSKVAGQVIAFLQEQLYIEKAEGNKYKLK